MQNARGDIVLSLYLCHISAFFLGFNFFYRYLCKLIIHFYRNLKTEISLCKIGRNIFFYENKYEKLACSWRRTKTKISASAPQYSVLQCSWWSPQYNMVVCDCLVSGHLGEGLLELLGDGLELLLLANKLVLKPVNLNKEKYVTEER